MSLSSLKINELAAGDLHLNQPVSDLFAFCIIAKCVLLNTLARNVRQSQQPALLFESQPLVSALLKQILLGVPRIAATVCLGLAPQ